MKSTRTRIKFVFAIIAAVFMLSALLFACDKPTVPEPDAEYILEKITENFENTPSIFVKGNVSYDGIITQNIEGTVNDTDKQIYLNIDSDAFIYTSKYLLKGTSDDIKVEKGNTSFNATLSYLPFSLYAFKYNKNFVGSVEKTDNHIIISFLEVGIKKVFNTKLNVEGGVFSISYSQNRITETVLTTTLTENGRKIRYSAHYYYSDGGKAFDTVPWVTPTNSIEYATYAVNLMAATHGEQTLKSAGNNRDTKVTMDAFNMYFDKVDDVYIIEAGGKYSLWIEYSSAIQILGLGSIDKLEIIYDADYNVMAVNVNESTKYTLS